LLVGEYEDHLDPVSDFARERLHSHPGVIMAGWSDEVEYYMPLAYALLHPSYREGFPNVVLQAGAMLCPVLCSKIPGNVDIVEHGVTGLIFEVKNAESLGQQLEFALQNPIAIQQYARALREKIETHFDQRVVHEAVRKKYVEILGIGI